MVQFKIISHFAKEHKKTLLK